ncbi:protein NATD1-like [Anopheles maculipalpis]|uniref:protein NATD1-like n=1 Tax=Anopheles maculipalpis TaxID=1496333 RepID=UPI0021595A4D|nr:protein NATD1-like [Anopheles maculipalpis]
MSCLLSARLLTSRISTTRAYCTATGVKNDTQRNKFVIELSKNDEAYLQYTVDHNANLIRFQHTYVPDAGKGKGLGKKLVESAFQYAIAQKMLVKLECDFAVKYFKDNQSTYKAYVTK